MERNPEELRTLEEFFNDLDRTIFLDSEYQDLAGLDRPLPIGHGQTISQPTLVFEMTSLLRLNKEHKVLEIGTGSGYQTAFLAKFTAQVYTVERIEALSLKAQERLKKLGYDNIRFKIGDGSEGWLEHAPYDRIMVTAGAGKLPEPIIEQLKPEGIMLIPVGEDRIQDLLLIRKEPTGGYEVNPITKVVFVELKGQYGWEKLRG